MKGYFSLLPKKQNVIGVKRTFKEIGDAIPSKYEWEDSLFSTHTLTELPLWEELARPKSLQDVKGQDSARISLEEWIKSPLKPLLLSGPTGCGKTSLVRTFLNSKNLRVWDESMANGEDSLSEAIIAVMSQTPLMGSQKRAILIECAEGLSSEEKSKLIKIFKGKITLPIIVTCDNAFDKNLKSLKDTCTLITMKPLTETIARSLMISSASKVGKQIAASSADLLLESSHWNVRHAINSMQFMVLTKNAKKSAKSALADTDASWDLFSSTARVCSGIADENAEDIASSDLDLALCALQHNLVPSSLNIFGAAKALDSLSFADIHMRRHENSLAVTISVRSTALACRKGAVATPRMQFPSIFGKMSSRSSRSKNLRKAASLHSFPKMIKTKDILYSNLSDGTNLTQINPSAFQSLDYMPLRIAQAKGLTPKELKSKNLWIDMPAVMDLIRKGDMWSF
jgi:hypothetical protein